MTNKTVPREPTEAMVQAGYDEYASRQYLIDQLPAIWQAMYDAAPEGEAVQPTLAATLSGLIDRFLSWPLPKDFAPDCGISFDGRKDDQWNKNKTWPIGTNLFTADQARQMLEYVLADALADVECQANRIAALDADISAYRSIAADNTIRIAALEGLAETWKEKAHKWAEQADENIAGWTRACYEKDRRIAALEAALRDCVAVVKVWHDADDVWDIYYNHAPEMKSTREALAGSAT